MLKWRVKIFLVIITTIIGVSIFGVVQAAFNPQINYQGKLTNNSDVAVTDGTYNLQFRLCADDGCSSVLWTEIRTSTDKVQVTNGLFSVLLGSVTSLSGVDFNQDVYLELQVGGTGAPVWETLLPRKKLGTVPSAFEAGDAALFDGLATTSFAKLATNETISGAWVFNNILSITANSASPSLNILQSHATGSGLSVGNGTATTTIFGGATSTFPYGATFATAGGNVGIGTAVAGARLTIQGTGATSASASLNVTNNAGTSMLYVRNDSRVGIGTINPSYPLHVSLSDATGNGNARILIENPSTSSLAFAVYEMRAGLSNGGLFFASNAALPNSGIVNGISFRANTGQDLGLGVSGSVPSIIVQGASSGKVGINAYNSTSAAWPTLLASGLTVGSGGSSQLPTAGTLVPVVRLIGAINNTTDNAILRLVRETNPSNLYNSAVDFNVKSYAAALGGTFYPKTQLTISLKSAASFVETADVDVMTLRDNGFVGIGTTVPSTTLHLVSTAEQLRLGYNGVNYTSFTVGTDGAITIATTNSATTTITNGLVINTNSLVVNKSTGYVGVGTTSPSYQLSVAGDINTTGTIRINGTDYGQFFINSAGVAGQLWKSDGSGVGAWADTSTFGFGNIAGTGTAGQLSYFTNGTTLASTSSLYWNSTNGRLGIGTSTPSEKLHITNGTLLVDSPNPALLSSITNMNYLDKASSLAISGKYAYVSSQINDGGIKGLLTVVDISDASHPVIVNSSTLGSSVPYSNCLAVNKKVVYFLGSDSTGASTLKSIDVSSPLNNNLNQYHQTAVGGLPKNSRSLFVNDKYAYSVSSNATTGTFSMVDIFDNNNGMGDLLVVGSVSDFSSQSILNNVNSIFVSGDFIYMTVATSTNATGTLIMRNVSFPNTSMSISNNDFISSSTQQAFLAGANDVYVSGNYAYVSASRATTGTVVIVDVANTLDGFQSSDTKNYIVGHVSSATDQALLAGANSIQVFGKYAYVTASSSLVVVDISSSTAPFVVGSISNASLNSISSLSVVGKYAYGVNGVDGIFSVLDIKGADIYAANVGNMYASALTVSEAGEFGSLLVNNGISSNGPMIVKVDRNFSSSNYAFNVSKTGQSNSWFLVNGNGQVLINTSTFSGASYKMVIDAGGSGGAGLGVNGYIKAVGTITTEALDLAEIYPVSIKCKDTDTCPKPGDLVCLDDSFSQGVKKCIASEKKSPIGIVSTKPGFLLDMDDVLNTTSTNFERVQVALAGRIPVNVSTIYGDIKIGDKLTFSDVDGIAAKAVGEVPTVGIAMENFSSSTIGSIITFVDLGWQNELYKALTLNTVSSTLTFGSDASPYNLLLNGNFDIFKEKIKTLSLSQDGQLLLSGGTSANLSLSNITNTSTGIYFDNVGGIGFVTQGEERMKIDAQGNVMIDVIVAKRHVVAEKYNLVENCDLSGSCPKVNEVVCLVATSSNFVANTVVRCENAYEENQIGVVLQSGDLVISSSTPVASSTLVVTSGKAKIKVSTINGEIKVGDYLTTATSGIAIKAIEPGKVIGVALENFTGIENGEIEISVDPQFAFGYLNAEGDLMISTSTPYAVNLFDKFTLAIKYSLKKMGLTIQNGIANLKEIFVEKVTTDNLCVGSTCVNEEQLKQLLETVGQITSNEPSPVTNGTTEQTNTPDETSFTTPVAPDAIVEPTPSEPSPTLDDVVPPVSELSPSPDISSPPVSEIVPIE